MKQLSEQGDKPMVAKVVHIDRKTLMVYPLYAQTVLDLYGTNLLSRVWCQQIRPCIWKNRQGKIERLNAIAENIYVKELAEAAEAAAQA